ncbi:hypothetical protein RDI58_020674 [Solanum bulbocastanum]|uniref:Transposase MuDR plant domain-containing protein n=1 Tax=Solanum bulbocastanum TaxID=147425 RepID=A0AAN8YAX0_SOLBU
MTRARLQGEESLVDVDVIEESDTTSEECESFHDSDYSLERDKMIFDKIVNSTAEWIGKKLLSLALPPTWLRFPVTLKKKDLEDPKFEFTLSMIFSSSKEFKWAAEGSAVMMKKDIKFKKNESSRARAICKVLNCKWFIYASKANEDEPFMIKTIGPDHSCGNQRENKTIDSEFSTKKYADEFKINPSWGVKEFQAHVMRKHRTKKEQFDMLWDYCAELRRSNPGTTCILKLDDNPETMVKDRKRFLRLYVCFAACKQGF